MLETFRGYVEQYLFDGYALRDGDPYPSEGYNEIKNTLSKSEFRELRRKINESKERVHNILEQCGVNAALASYPPPAIGGPVIQARLIDLITANTTYEYLERDIFLDAIDSAIGVLRSKASRQDKSTHVMPPKPAPRMKRDYWKYTNPFWIIWVLGLRIWRHKVISTVIGIILTLLVLLAFDYNLILRNIKTIVEYITDLVF